MRGMHANAQLAYILGLTARYEAAGEANARLAAEAYFRADQSIGSFGSEIWLPDIQPYNAHESFVSTLEPSPAKVLYDGTVFWSRPGLQSESCGLPKGSWGMPRDSQAAPIGPKGTPTYFCNKMHKLAVELKIPQ